MDNFKLVVVKENQRAEFIKDIQEAFQKGYEDVYGACSTPILPQKDIEESFNAKGSETYFAVLDGKIVGGAVANIDKKTEHNHLDLLYVKVGCQSKGVGQLIWNALEKLHPETKVWETYTSYFETRNIHFYVNKCGFHIVEFFNPQHKDPHQDSEQVGGMPSDVGDYFFRFEKVMK